MNSILNLGDKKYISAKRVHELYGYSSDYVGQLCRSGKLDCQMVGQLWYVTEQSVVDYKLALVQDDTASKISEKVEDVKQPEPSPVPESIAEPEQKVEVKHLPEIVPTPEVKVEPLERIIELRKIEEPVREYSVFDKANSFKVAQILEEEAKSNEGEVKSNIILPKAVLISVLFLICMSSAAFASVLKFPQISKTFDQVKKEMGYLADKSLELSANTISNTMYVVGNVASNISRDINTGAINVVNNTGNGIDSISNELKNQTASVLSTVGDGIYSLQRGIRTIARNFLGIEDYPVPAEKSFYASKEYKAIMMATTTNARNISVATTTIVVQKPNYVFNGANQKYIDDRISMLNDQIIYLSNHGVRQTDTIYTSIGNSISNTSENITNNLNTNITNAISGGSSNFSGSSLAISGSTTLSTLTVGPITADSLYLNDSSPVITNNLLYSNSGSLYWSGNLIGGASTGNWSTDGTNAWRTTGNVGIGTTSPTAKLDVLGRIALGSRGVSSHNTVSSATSSILWASQRTSDTTLTNIVSENNLELINGADSSQAYVGNVNYVGTDSGNIYNLTGAGRMIGTQNQVQHYGTGTIANEIGIISYVLNKSTGTVSNAYGGRFGVFNDGTGTISNGYGLYVKTPSNLGTLSNNYGLYLEDQSVGSNTYSIYSAGGKNYFAGNVGIGTSTPANTLHVSNNVVTATNGDVLNSYSIARFVANTTLNNLARGLQIGAPAGGVNAPVFIKVLGTSSRFSIVDNNNRENLTILEGGRVGLGTTTPLSTLDIYGTAGSSDIFAISSSTNARLLTVTANGNVGIGTAAPTLGKLQVSGNVAIDSGNSLLLYRSDNTRSGALYTNNSGTFLASNAANSDPLYLQAPGTTGDIYFMPGGTTIVKMRLFSTGGLNLGTGAFTADPGAGNMTIQGNVGIGTTSPQTQLHLSGTTPYIRQQATSGSNFYYLTSAVNFNSGNAWNVTFNTVSGANDTIINYSSPDISKILTLGTTTGKVVLNGNVGIGTTTPSAKLDIYGTAGSSDIFAISSSTNARLLTVTAAGNVGIGATSPVAKLNIVSANSPTIQDLMFTFDGSGNYRNGIANSMDSSIVANNKMYFRVGDSTATGQNTIMTLVGNGNVGIGNLIPQSKLGVSGSQSVGATYGSIAAPTSGMIIEGNVGIGTTSPAYKLDVYGAGDNFARIDSGSATGDVGLYLRNGSRNWLVYSNAPNNDFTILDATYGTSPFIVESTTPSNTLYLDSTGNIGIGTTSPAEKLEVAGSILLANNQNIKFYNPTGTISSVLNYDTTGHLNISAPTAGDDIYFRTAGNINMRVSSGGNINLGGLSAAGSPKMYIDGTTGYVGIGTTSPNETFVIGANKLRIDSNGRLKLNGTQNAFGSSVIDFSNSASFSSASLITGLNGETTNSGSGSVIGSAINAVSSYAGTVSALIGVQGAVRTLNSSTVVTDSRMFNASSPTITAGAITNQYGLYINAQKLAGVTSGYGIYQSGLTDINYFAGNVGIGTTTPTAMLHVAGTMRNSTFGTGNLQSDASGNITVSSDERLKNIQGNFNRGLSDILNINPILYKWKDTTGYDTLSTYAGFSAQNIQASIPEAVGVDPSGMLTLSDRPILATLVNAMKELNTTVNTISTSTAVSTTTIIQTIVGPQIDMALMASTTANTIEGSESFISTIAIAVKNIISSTGDWVVAKITATSGYFTGLFADKVTTKELCIEDVCVTKTELQALLMNMHASTTDTVVASTTATTTTSTVVTNPVLVIPQITNTTSIEATTTVNMATTTNVVSTSTTVIPTESATATTTAVVTPTADPLTESVPPGTTTPVVEAQSSVIVPVEPPLVNMSPEPVVSPQDNPNP